jgi:uncharacterized RDD family membrane protein YckC
MFCSGCGAEIMPGAQFCPKCGRPIGGATPAAYAAQGAIPAQYQAGPQFAGFWLRFVAYLIDGVILGIPVGIICFFIFGIMGGAAALSSRIQPNPDPEVALTQATTIVSALIGFIFVVVLVVISINWLYFAYMESSERQATLGKIVMNLRVTDANGNRLTFGHATGRYFAKIVTGLVPLFIGWIMAGFTEKKQALHDFIAGTLVYRRN